MSDETPYDKQLKKFLLPILRKRSLWWPERNEALKLAKRGPNSFECAACHKLFVRGDIQMDHRSPVINVKTSWVDWNSYIHSLLPYRDGWQALCRTCHLSKTQCENEIRAKNKKKSRKTKKSID